MFQSGAAAFVTAALVSIVLGGCGGGGGSNSAPIAPTATSASTSLRQLTDEQTFTGPSLVGSYSPAALTSEHVHWTSVETDTTTRITIKPGGATSADPYSIRIQAQNLATNVATDRTYDANAPAGFSDPWPFGNIRTTLGQYQTIGPYRTAGYIHANDLSAPSSLSYQLFGYWLNEKPDTRQDFGYFSVGVNTALNDIPRFGRATYEGFFIGAASNDLTSITASQTANSRLIANVDFNARTIELNTTGTQLRSLTSASWTADPTWDVQGTLTWNAGATSFQGRVSAPARSASGAAAGRFYGPNATELGGVLNAATSNGGAGITGAFGAARGPITTP